MKKGYSFLTAHNCFTSALSYSLKVCLNNIFWKQTLVTRLPLIKKRPISKIQRV